MFPGGPGLVGTRMSPFWILLELRMIAVVVTTGAMRLAKLQSNQHHQQTNTQCFTGQMPFLSPNQQHRSTEGKPSVLHCYWLIVSTTLLLLLLLTSLFLLKITVGEASHPHKALPKKNLGGFLVRDF